MSEPLRISVGVATCGRPSDLRTCLAAVARQTRAPAEVVVVDQEPSPEARAVVEQSGLASITYVEQERLGLSASRNLALELAAGDLLAVTDDDCAPDERWLEAIAGAFARAPQPEVVTGPIHPLGDAPAGGHAISLRVEDAACDYRGRVQPWGVGSGGNFAGAVSLLRRLGGWDERLGAGSAGMAAEDAEIIYRALLAGSLIRFEPAAIVRHAWQTADRRMATRWSYGFGVGAMCGLLLAGRDPYSLRMLAGYLNLHVRPAVKALLRREWGPLRERALALAGPFAGLVYGLRSSRRPARVRG
jgi:GT2 family glycosyltransferase